MPPNQSLYDALSTTARSTLLSVLPATPGSNNPSPTAILSNFSPSFRAEWGHRHFVSSSPALQKTLNGEAFIAHLHSMAPKLKTWTIDITDMAVDVEKRSVVVRADYGMFPAGYAEGEEAAKVVNEIVFWLEMTEDGGKVVRQTEFVDASATVELGRLMRAAAAAGNVAGKEEG